MNETIYFRKLFLTTAIGLIIEFFEKIVVLPTQL